jgi:hypothetical protein
MVSWRVMLRTGYPVWAVGEAMSGELQVLRIVTGRLDAAAVPYMVTGSMALNYYAVPRMTRDIDIVVDPTADVDRLCELFRDDFYVEPDAVREAVERHSIFNMYSRYLNASTSAFASCRSAVSKPSVNQR